MDFDALSCMLRIQAIDLSVNDILSDLPEVVLAERQPPLLEPAPDPGR